MNWYHWEHGILTLNIHVQPKASKDEWAGLHGDRLKLRIKAAPIDGKANQHLIAFIADQFGIPKSACKLISGESGREKRIAIHSPKKLPSLPHPLQFDISF
ncbi:DUF167 family protein [Methylobacter sp.]|uniref:DUF167 family protein n=1 Tax=Methylobacter sp. TaxID=2051955 RepID=UPI001201F288|nr:DUF167 family protein [Methylobacter sp.]TAK60835.1 MAG: YggU family protein [Methylobacter sp.]